MQAASHYTLYINHYDQALVCQGSDNLSRLTAKLFALLEDEFPNSNGYIIDNATNEIVRSARCATVQ